MVNLPWVEYHLWNTYYLILKIPPPALVTVHLINWLLVSMRRTRLLYSSKGDPFTLCTAEISERQPEQNWKNAINFIGVKLNIPLPKHTPPSWFFFKNNFSHREKLEKLHTNYLHIFGLIHSNFNIHFLSYCWKLRFLKKIKGPVKTWLFWTNINGV